MKGKIMKSYNLILKRLKKSTREYSDESLCTITKDHKNNKAGYTYGEQNENNNNLLLCGFVHLRQAI